MRRIITLLLLAPILYLAALVIASEYGGEVVVLETENEQGGRFETSLWIVDLYGDTWLRSGDPNAAWLMRIRNNPEVIVIRDGERLPYHAEIVPDFGSRINAGMAEKYGFANTIVSTVHDGDGVVAIRLEAKDEE